MLTIRSDKPEAEIGLFDNGRKLAYETWPAHRQLAETIHAKIRDLLASQKKQLVDLQAVAVFRGPGSFTGLRIGISVANALADSLDIPIAGSGGDDWVARAAGELQAGKNDRIVQPEYGAAPRITKPKH